MTMKMFLLQLLCLFYVFSLTDAHSHSPRMVFSHDESHVTQFTLPGRDAPVQVLLTQPDVVTSVGERHVNFYNFQTPQKDPVEKTLVWKDCTDQDYNVTVVHQREKDGLVFVCGTNGRITRCCNMKLSEQSHECVPSATLNKIQNTIRDFVIKRGEHSVLTDSGQSEELYVTYSGAHEHVGLHKFGSGGVRPANHNEEQHYAGLVLSRRNDSSQNKIYAFYKEKNKETGMDGDMWLPYVSQVCMSDIGGPKNNLQFSWTSQMNARLYCGNPNTKQDFSELVDMATVCSDQWEETKVYALFRNEWGTSAVCVYTIRDISDVFTNSRFKGSTTYDEQDQRRKECVPDSTKIPTEILMRIKETSEMEQWVLPVNKSGPILFKHHSYTHIQVDASLQMVKDHHVVMFLTLNDGRIHKAVQNGNHSFVIAEYQPFNVSANVLGVILHHSSKNLYVNSRSELVQLSVANCAQYGNTCEECVLSRDPYCRWTDTECTAGTRSNFLDMNKGYKDICSSLATTQRLVGNCEKNYELVSPQSKYFLSCAMSSLHARYTWDHPGGSTSCDSKDGKCVLLIDSMGPGQEGTYECKSEELEYSRVLQTHCLRLSSAVAGWTPGPAVWVCLVAVLVQSF